LSKEDTATIESLLKNSRTLLSTGNPQEALERVIDVIRLTQGDDTILKVLDVAKNNTNSIQRVLTPSSPTSTNNRNNIIYKMP
jgi:hypothetical protein